MSKFLRLRVFLNNQLLYVRIKKGLKDIIILKNYLK